MKDGRISAAPLCHCWRHVGAAITAAITAVLLLPLPPSPLPPSPLPLPLPRLPLSPCHHQHHFCCYCYRFLVDCCLPLRCLCFGHRCLPWHLPLLAANAIATVVAAENRCLLLLPPQLCDVQNITFKVIFWTSLLPLLVDCCLPFFLVSPCGRARLVLNFSSFLLHTLLHI